MSPAGFSKNIFRYIHTVFLSVNLYMGQFWIVEFINYQTKTTQLVTCTLVFCWVIVDIVLTRVHRLHHGLKIKINHKRRQPFWLIFVKTQNFCIHWQFWFNQPHIKPCFNVPLVKSAHEQLRKQLRQFRLMERGACCQKLLTRTLRFFLRT